MDKKEIKRRKMSEEARERRRRHRRRVVMIERITLALFLVVILVGGTALAWNLAPGIKVAKRLEAAEAYMVTKAYDEAIASCEAALEIDSSSIKAYRAMAGVYQTKEDWEAAEQILYKGWETTQDEGLFQEYCVQILNEAVTEINEQNCTFSTLDKCLTVLEKNPANEDVYPLLDACYERIFMMEDAELFLRTDEDGTYEFDRYMSVMNRMLDVYGGHPAPELKNEIIKYVMQQNTLVWMQVYHVPTYLELLTKVSVLGDEGMLDSMKNCLEKAVWAQNIFEPAFDIFESGEYQPIKEFMQSEDYISIRDQFMNETMEYWSGKTYIPISKEKIKLMNENGQWSFSFADFDECPETAGVIKVWEAKQEDDGVQRLCISYEPASENGEYYPHTTYEFTYLYSNVKIGDQYVPQMNYRFETRIAAPEGTTSELIGDWGGEHEWSLDY